MNARGFVALGVAAISDDGLQWIEVMPTATDAKNGPYRFTVDRADLDTYAKSITANPGRIPVDYDHQGANPDGSTRAAGWFTGQARVEDRPGGPVLLAEVQWTPKAAQEIRDGEWRFTSAEFSFLERDKKTGLMTKAKAIIASTLTNRPFFKDLAALASDLDDSTIAAFAAALGVTTEQVERAISTGGAAALIEGDPPMNDTLKALAVALGLNDDATDEEIKAAAEAAKGTAAELETVKQELADLKATAATAAGDADRIKTLEDTLAAERNLRISGERETALTRAVEERRIDPAAKAVLAEQFGDNIDGLKALLAAMPPKTVTASGSGGPGKDDDTDLDTAPITIQGSEYPIDEDSAKVHAKAVASLKQQGKTTYTAAEYLAAAEAATAELAAA